MRIRSLGQSGFILTYPDGTVLMTDPWLGDSWLKRYKTPVDHETVRQCDILLASHAHLDHLDACALRMAKRLGSIVIGSKRAVHKARRAGIQRTIGLDPGDEVRAPGSELTIHAVPAFHPLANDALGFVIENENTVYFSGDTRYHEELIKELDSLESGIDIAMLQIACAVYFFRKDGLDVEDAAGLARQIQPTTAIPMHYHDRFRALDPEIFKERLATTTIHVDILDPGQEIVYE